MSITVVPGDWGKMKSEDVKFLLNNVAQHFLRCFSAPFFARLSVQCQPERSTGKVECRRWFNRGRKHWITLCTDDCCQWSFQFAHELCHILSNYDLVNYHQNDWFYEALCDTASIFTVRQMAVSWRQAYPLNWAWFSIRIQRYAQTVTTHNDFQLPSNVNFPTWFKANERTLTADRYQRRKNGIIALQLLPILERNPDSWEAIRYLPASGRVFGQLLHNWRQRCQPSQKPFVTQIMKTFGIRRDF